MDCAMAALAMTLPLVAGCARKAEPDAYGNVEATEVVVGAEATGRLLTYTVADGSAVQAGAVVGTIDAAQLAFERDQLIAQHAATRSRADEVRQQMSALESQRGIAVTQRDSARAQREALAAQLEIARRAHQRTQRLVEQQAATAQQLDQAERDERVLVNQIAAQDEQIKAQERQIAAQTDLVNGARAQEKTIAAQVAGAGAQVSQAGERIRKTEVHNPIDGTVLTSYVKAGRPGRCSRCIASPTTSMEPPPSPSLSPRPSASVRRLRCRSIRGGLGRPSRGRSRGFIARGVHATPIQTCEER
jgi:HlyD family secretion protein